MAKNNYFYNKYSYLKQELSTIIPYTNKKFKILVNQKF